MPTNLYGKGDNYHESNSHVLPALLDRFDFHKVEKKQSMLLNVHNLIYRLEPSDKELRIFASIISALSEKKY